MENDNIKNDDMDNINTENKEFAIKKIEGSEVPGKDIALISYLTVIGLVIAFVMNNDKKHEFARFHMRQSLGIFLTGLALSVIAMIPILGWLIWIVGFFLLVFMWIKGVMNAVNGKMEVVPVFGAKYADFFKNL